MELSNNNTVIPINTTTVKTPDAETEPRARIIQHSKPFSTSNGVLKRHNHHHSAPAVVVYKECLKNHAATMGGHAVDGCGEFMPSPTATAADPTSLKCAACGCHRNFHRRDPEELFPSSNTAAALEYQPHHRHHPPPPLPPPNHGSGHHRCPNSPSPPPISSAYYPSAPHMLLALSSGFSGRPVENNNLSSKSRSSIRVWKKSNQEDLCSQPSLAKTAYKKESSAKEEGCGLVMDHQHCIWIHFTGVEAREQPIFSTSSSTVSKKQIHWANPFSRSS